MTALALHTIADLHAMLSAKIRITERTLRRQVRASGAYMVHRNQILMTDADLAAVMESLRPCSIALDANNFDIPVAISS